MNLIPRRKKTKRIFLDYASTTPILPIVKKEMDKYLGDNFFNPSAIYDEGVKLRKDLVDYRKEVARILHVSSKDVIFTSGGTESDNLAMLGIFEASREKIKKPHIIISSIEHSAILEAAKKIERRGGEVTYLDVNEYGFVEVSEVKNSLKPETILVSVIYANNEIGSVQNVSKISRIIKEFRKENNTNLPFFHTDGSQAANYLTLDVSSLGVDLLTLDGSKIYGPKGAGVLVVRPNVVIEPILFGGGQENGLRSGTENMALIGGFTQALVLANKDREKESLRVGLLKEKFIEIIKKDFPEIIINTPEKNSLPNIISISIPNFLGELVAIKLGNEGVMVSTGSSCGIFKDQAGSNTIKAIGKESLAESTIRFSLGRFTEEKDIFFALKALKKSLF